MDLVNSTRLPVSSTPATINVHAFLPRDLHQLRRLVLSEANIKENNFVTFMLDGCLHVRAKGEKLSTPIYAAADLDNFLGQLSATGGMQSNSQSDQDLT